MTNDPILGKIRRAVLILQVANGIAAIAFFWGYSVSHESLFLIAGICMIIAVIGMFFLRRRIFAKLMPGNNDEQSGSSK